jgi:hypothetical protein
MNRFVLSYKSAMKARGSFSVEDRRKELRHLINITNPETGIRIYAERKLALLRKAANHPPSKNGGGV